MRFEKTDAGEDRDFEELSIELLEDAENIYRRTQ
jgi:hypothetical protein